MKSFDGAFVWQLYRFLVVILLISGGVVQCKAKKSKGDKGDIKARSAVEPELPSIKEADKEKKAESKTVNAKKKTDISDSDHEDNIRRMFRELGGVLENGGRAASAYFEFPFWYPKVVDPNMGDPVYMPYLIKDVEQIVSYGIVEQCCGLDIAMNSEEEEKGCFYVEKNGGYWLVVLGCNEERRLFVVRQKGEKGRYVISKVDPNPPDKIGDYRYVKGVESNPQIFNGTCLKVEYKKERKGKRRLANVKIVNGCSVEQSVKIGVVEPGRYYKEEDVVSSMTVRSKKNAKKMFEMVGNGNSNSHPADGIWHIFVAEKTSVELPYTYAWIPVRSRPVMVR